MMVFELGDERLPARFWDKVVVDGHCWVWNGARSGNGYGSWWNGTGRGSTHRSAYAALVGPIPDDLVLDHLCRNRACVNPAHLEPVTQAVNQRRGLVNQHKDKSECPKGHAFEGTNLIVERNGRRRCRACTNARAREYKRAWRARMAAA